MNLQRSLQGKELSMQYTPMAGSPDESDPDSCTRWEPDGK